jgi:GNAT superfamily N-acetyltransferase
MSALSIRPLTPDLWPAFEDLFGPNGACSGCWCMWWRMARTGFVKGQGPVNKAAFKRIVKRGPPPGLLAFESDVAVGWCQLTPRSDLPVLDRSRMLVPVDDKPVWSLSCFYVRKGYRKRGVTSALITAAVKEAKKQGAPALEAYPWDTAEKKGASTVHTGVASTFARAGFDVVARRAAHRPIMRKTLRKSAA